MTRGLSPAARLEARDQGARLHPVDRALVLLALAAPEAAAEMADLPLGERDRRLLAHRRATFGDRIPCLVDCPRCAAAQEFDLSASALLDGLAATPGEETLEAEGWRVRLRPLASRDLAAAASHGEATSAAAALVACAIAAAEAPSGARDRLPASVWAIIKARVAEREGAAEIALDLSCADCGHAWTAPFDIGSCFWSEVEADARRLLVEVATLAQRFGWSEADLLAMSAARRRTYLELAGAS